MSKAQLAEAEQLIKSGSFEVDYDVEHELGRGRFAIVKRCVNKKTGTRYAAKVVKKSRSNTHGRSGREQLLMEISILHRSTHPKMVRLYDVFETRSEMQLILEYAEGGDLHRHCIETDIARTEKEICYLIRQILEAVRYLHNEKVVHLDLKPDNILLAKKKEVFPEIRLIDFGLSRSLDGPYSQFDIVGTAEYVSPEVLAFDAIDYGSDMWSIGVVTYVLLSGISPFAGDDVMETYANIGLVEYDFDCEEFDDISDAATDFIEKLLLRDPKKRMSAREALEHEWIKQLDGGVSTQDVILAQQAKKEPLPDDVEISPLHEEEIVSSSESDASSLEKSSEITDEEPDNCLEKKNDVTVKPCEMLVNEADHNEEGSVLIETIEKENINLEDEECNENLNVNQEENIYKEENEKVLPSKEEIKSNEENEKVLIKGDDNKLVNENENIDEGGRKCNDEIVLEEDEVADEITPLPKEREVLPLTKEKEILPLPKEKDVLPSPREKEIPSPAKEKEVPPLPKEKEVLSSPKENEVLPSPKEKEVLSLPKEKEVLSLPKEKDVEIVEVCEESTNIDSSKGTNGELPKKHDTPKSTISDKMAKFSSKPEGVASPRNDKFKLPSSKSFDTVFLSKDKKPASKMHKLERSTTIRTDEQELHPSLPNDNLPSKKSPEIKPKSVHQNGTAEKQVETVNSSDVITEPTEKVNSIKEKETDKDKPFKKKIPVPLPGKKAGDEYSKHSAPITKIKPGGIAAKMAKFGKPDANKLSPVSKTGNKYEKRDSAERRDSDELNANDLFKKKHGPNSDSNKQKDLNEPINHTNSSKSFVENAEQTSDGEHKSKTFNKPKSPPLIKCKPKSPINGKMVEIAKDESKSESTTPKSESFTPKHGSPTPKHKSPTGHKSPTFKHESPSPRYTSPTHRHMSPTPGSESPSRFESPPPSEESHFVRHGSPIPRNESPTLRTQSPILRHASPTSKCESPTPRSLECSPKVERKAKSPPPKPKAKPLKKPPEIPLKPVRSRPSDVKNAKEGASKPLESAPQSENIPDAEPEREIKAADKPDPKPEPEPADAAKALAAKVGSGLKFSLNIGGANTGGKKLNIGPLISVGSKGSSKEVKSHDVPESLKPVDKEEKSESIPELNEVTEVKVEQNIGNSDRPTLSDTRGKNESFSRRRGPEDNSHRKTYRRLYVTKVRNSKVYEHDFDISTEAAKIVQRVDKDVLQVEVKLKSTDLKLLP